MKKALLIGINYVGTGNDLRGCLNDVANIKKVLQAQGFDEIKELLETQATTQNIMDGMRWLVAGAVPGDVLYMHYSGHGSQIRSAIEPDGLDEIICPINLNWRDKVVRDDHMKEILGKAPNGVNLTVVLDCCHSGTALDQDDTYAMARVYLHQETPAREDDSRFLPVPSEVQAEIDKEGLQIRAFKTSRDINRSALLIAGCQSHQTSADAYIEGTFQGAATYALLEAIKAGKQTYRDIADYMTDYMISENFEQRPQLDGHPSLYDQAFARPFGELEGTPVETPAPGTWVDPSAPAPAPAPAPVIEPAAPEASEASSKMALIVVGAVILAIAALIFLR